MRTDWFHVVPFLMYYNDLSIEPASCGLFSYSVFGFAGTEPHFTSASRKPSSFNIWPHSSKKPHFLFSLSLSSWNDCNVFVWTYKEISLGIIGNLACHEGLLKHIESTSGLVNTLVGQLFLDDTQCLTEVCRQEKSYLLNVKCRSMLWSVVLNYLTNLNVCFH